MEHKSYCAIGFNNRLRAAALKWRLYTSNMNVYFYNTFFCPKELLKGRLSASGRVVFRNRGVGQVKDMYHDLQEMIFECTDRFFDDKLKDALFVRYANGYFKAGRYDAYVKEKLAFDFYEILSGLHLVKEFSEDKRAVMIDSSKNRFITEEFFKKNPVDIEIKWLRCGPLFFAEIPAYYAYVIKKMLFNGLSFRKRRDIKLYRKVTFGLSRPILSDDFLIDKTRFKKEDIIFYSKSNGREDKRAAAELVKEGYEVVKIDRMPVNVSGIADFLCIFFVQPARLLISLLLSGKTRNSYCLEYALKFYFEAMPHFLFLTNYRAHCHVSASYAGEAPETMIMNRYGCLNIIYKLSDTTSGADITHSFGAQNLFCAWGPVYESCSRYHFHDRVESVGCIFLKYYFDSLENSKAADGRKRILVCDSSCGNAIPMTEDLYLDFLDVVKGLIEKLGDTVVLFKPKAGKVDTLSYFFSEEKKKSYSEKMESLNESGRFIYHDPAMVKHETLMASSDLVLTMGTTSPFIIALILGKEALAYDNTGCPRHPFSKYMDSVVFNDREKLIEQAGKLLKKEASVFHSIDSGLLAQYEPYRDSHALERLISAVYKETEARAI